ncbi:MAG: alkaline phosphatase family protein [Acidobacteria bacterium]|nr:alkaline phosphatase family protein [Acidobacteriota bacterium]
MKILIIGLDAATMDLVKPWTQAGHLPTLARLMQEGAYSMLLSTPNMHSASAWTSILTGLNPGRHGLYVFSDRDFKTAQQVFFKGGDRQGDLLTRHLSRQGLTTGMLNVPMTYPAECSAGGFMISGLDAPSLNANCFCPPELREELLRVVPDYHFTPARLGNLMSAGKITEAVETWLHLIGHQTAAAEYLLNKYQPDFFMTVYTASDWGGHNLWKYADEHHPDYDPRSPHRDSLLTIYRALDAAIERLLQYTNEATQVYVISDHGMGLHSGASYHLAEWLEQRGYMRRRKPVEKGASLRRASRRAAKNILPTKLKEKIKAKLGDERVQQLQAADKDSFYASIDWAETSAYTEAGRHVININLAGRNQHGSVAAADYVKVCDKLMTDLLNWKDARGNRVVERVTRRDEVYQGEYAERASDLYVYWNRAAHLGKPPAEVQAKGFWWSGDHRPEGILIGHGKGIRPMQELNLPTPPQVYDLVPTLLHLAGLAVPEGLDGRVIEALDAQDSAVRFAKMSRETTDENQALSDEEERLIEEKLRALGYL